jgi:hypothetical protein
MHIPLKWRYAEQLGLIRLNQPDGGEGGGGGDDGGDNDQGSDQQDKGNGGRKAPWDAEDFDAEKARRLFSNMQSDLDKAKTARDDFKKKYEDGENAKLTDQQRAEKERDDSKAETTNVRLENARLRALIKHGLDEEDLDFIGGATPEEIEANAQKYADRNKDRRSAPQSQRPKTRLKGGTDPGSEPDELDPTKLAEAIPRN